jgi:gamma-glutamyltranspeptidase
VAVPGELQGLEAAWKRFGSKPWAQLVKPAADLARTGFAAHPYLVYIMSGEANLNRMKVIGRAVGCLSVWGCATQYIA